MSNIVKVCIPQKEAFKRCNSEWGNLPIPSHIFEEVLKSLDPEEREWLTVSDQNLCIYHNGIEYLIKASECKVSFIVEGVRAILEKIKKQKEQERQKALAKLNTLLEKPEDYIFYGRLEISYSGTRDTITQLCQKAEQPVEPYIEAINNAFEKLKQQWAKKVIDFFSQDLMAPSITLDQYTLKFSTVYNIAAQHEMTEIVQLLDKRIQLENEQNEKRIQLENEQNEKEMQISEASKQTWIQYCLDNCKPKLKQDLQFAIENDYPIGTRCDKWVIEYLMPDFEDIDCYWEEQIRKDLGDRRLPNKQARQLQEVLQNVVKQIKLPEGTTMIVGRIRSISLSLPCTAVDHDEVHCDVCDGYEEIEVNRTAVPITIKAPHIAKETAWFLSPEANK